MGRGKNCPVVELDPDKVRANLGFREVAPEELLDDYPKSETDYAV